MCEASASFLWVDVVEVLLRAKLHFEVLSVCLHYHNVSLHELVDLEEAEMGSDINTTHIDR